MFRCSVSGRLSNPREKTYKVVVKSRNVSYENKIMRGEREHIINSTGWEIVEEKIVCEEVYRRMMNENVSDLSNS